MAENVSFGITSTLQLMREPTPDVVYMNTWPIFAQWMNTVVLSHHRVPVICAVKDLYPETFSNTGRISQNNPIIWLTKAIGTHVYRQSTLIAPLNPLMKEYIIADRDIYPEKVRVLPDWIDASHFPRHQPKDWGFRRKHAFSSDLFLAMYVGSMTHMAGLELYIETAERLRQRQDIRILLVGDGAMREKIEVAIRQKALDNIQMIYPLKPEDVAEVQAAADVLVLSLLRGAAEHATPSKLISYMFSQRPVLASVHACSSPARIIQDAKCGYVIRQGDPKELAVKLEQMADDRTSLQQLGENSRRYAEENFLKDNILPRVCNLLEQGGV
jgi:glycosyltransferase involved in cell wall biosynthesis